MLDINFLFTWEIELYWSSPEIIALFLFYLLVMKNQIFQLILELEHNSNLNLVKINPDQINSSSN